MLIRPTVKELEEFGTPDFIIYNAGQFPANRFTAGMTSSTSVEVNFKRKEMVILGTEYAGEMKKGIFSVMVRSGLLRGAVCTRADSTTPSQHYLQPVKFGQLSLHSSANEGVNGDVTLFFGLSGTGKTTLSADPLRQLIGDDEVRSSVLSTRVRTKADPTIAARLVRHWSLQHRGRMLRQVRWPQRREGARDPRCHQVRIHPRERYRAFALVLRSRCSC